MAEMLYEDKQLKVQFDPSKGGHFLSIKGANYFFQGGLLEDMARTPRGNLERKLDAINPDILWMAREARVSVDAIGYALSQARVEELEKELSASYSRRA